MKLRIRLLIPLLALAGAACDDPFGPRAWLALPDSAVLYSASRPELLGLPAAYDFVSQREVVIENPTATDAWDFVVTESDGAFRFMPAGELPGVTSRAAIAPVQAATLEEVERAPGGDEFVQESVPLTPGEIYVVRSRTASCGGLGSGVFYAKFQVVAVDAAEGTVRIAAIRNPYCNDRDLVPPEIDD